jgi:hypothetical protein
MAIYREEDNVTNTTPEDITGRLEAMEERLARLETLLVGLTQQLVPETCEHAPEPEASDGPYLPGTTMPCTDDVVHRVGRIPIPFVRQMVVEKVAQQAQQEHIARVDVAFFERAATF